MLVVCASEIDDAAFLFFVFLSSATMPIQFGHAWGIVFGLVKYGQDSDLNTVTEMPAT